MNNSPNMSDNIDTQENSDDIKNRLPPMRPPVLLRQNATWDEYSMQIEKERINKILTNMGISLDYNKGR